MPPGSDAIARSLVAAFAAIAAHAIVQVAPPPADPRVEWTVLAPVRTSTISGATLAPQADGSLLVQGPSTATDTFTLEFESLPKGVTALRLEAIADPSLPGKGPGRTENGNFVLSELRASTGPRGTRKPRMVALQNATASYAQDGFAPAGVIDGVPTTGWAIHPRMGASHDLIVETRSDLSLDSGVLVVELEFANGGQHTLGRLRVSATTAARPVRGGASPADAAQWGEIQTRINRAIDQGCEWLLTQQVLDGSFDVDEATYRNGGTALVTYALLKSGVPRSHPAIARALEFMRSGNSRETYTLGCQLLALHTLKDPDFDPWIRQLGEQLLQFQQQNGGFHYGANGGGIDLSNSQYGALGLRVAALHGLKVPPDVWDKLAAFVLGQSEGGAGGGYVPLGFLYNPTSKATGSMTAAGAGILAICDEQLKGRTAKAGNLIGMAKRGAEWLGQNFIVDGNPRSGGEWLYYYLYGVERVGALLQMEEMGGHRWYREGAKWLVEHQDADGKWSFAGNNQLCNTSWALLFLTRATSPTSGVTTTRATKTFGGDDPRAAVSIRASGDSPLTFWISSWGEAEVASYEWPGESGRGLRVQQVEWFSVAHAGDRDETSLARIDKDGQQPCGRERFGAQYAFPLPGQYSLFVRVHLLGPPVGAGGPSEVVVLESPMVAVKIDETNDPELLRYASDPMRDLLLGQKPTITTSSKRDDWWEPRHLCDGLLVRPWASADNEANPKITIELEKPARANLLLVTPAVISPEHPARIKKILVTINGKGPPLELTIETAPNRKSKLRLPQPTVVRRIDLEVTDVAWTDGPKKAVAIAEVELQMESAGKK